MTAPDHTTKPLKNTLRERGHPYMEFEGAVISGLFTQPGEVGGLAPKRDWASL